MCRAPRSSGQPKGPALRAVFLLLAVPVLLAVKTNSQKLQEPAIEIIRMLEENMKEVKNQIATMQTNLMDINKEILNIKQFNSMPVTATEQESNEDIICPDFFIPINITGECFLIVSNRLTYKEASNKCTSIGANLAIPRDYKSLSFIESPESPPIARNLWIGLDDKLTPNYWRWIDGTPIHNTNGLDNLNLTHNLPYPAKPGFNCGVLSLRSRKSPSAPLKFDLERGRCDIEEKGYLCEIKPGKTPFDIDVSPALCPVGFSVLGYTRECIYISTVEESTSYLEAENICSSRGAKLAEPMDVSILSTYLQKQNLVDDPGFWLYIEYLNSYPYIFQSWNDTAPDILKVNESLWPHPGYDFWLSKGYCPLLKAGAIPYDWDNGEVDDCSASHRFICKSKHFTMTPY